MNTCTLLGLLISSSTIVTAPPKPAVPTPAMRAVLNELTALGPIPVEKQEARIARQLPGPANAASALLAKRGKPGMMEVAKVTHFKVPSSTGEILVRSYRGKGAPLSNGPALVYFHGGGWVIGGLDSYDASCRALANMAKCTVLSVSYRQAPENKFPAAHDDAYTATTWIMQNASKCGVSSAKIAIGGESAGGNLAVATALRMKRSADKLPKHIVAVYPIAGYSANTPSYMEHANAKPLNALMMRWFFDKYLRSSEDGRNDYISLVSADDLAGLPSTTFVFAEIDPLLSEGQMLAKKMRSAGVSVSERLYMGVTHEFFGMGALVPEANAAEIFVARNLTAAWMR